MKTTDGGATWNPQSCGIVTDLSAVHFVNDQLGWVVSFDGMIFKTTDGGINWNNQSPGTNTVFFDVFFIDPQSGWAVGSDGTIFRTSNGGASWLTQISGTDEWFAGVSFVNAQTGWVVGLSGKILKTTNGGASWQSQLSGTSEQLWEVQFINSQQGWAVGSNGIVLRTVNGGVNWLQQTSGSEYYFNDLSFLDNQTGWICGNHSSTGDGVIFKTTNGGISWEAQVPVDSVYFTADKGWAVGNSGAIVSFEGVSYPAAGFNWLAQGLTAQFSNTSTDADNYFWDFGDGTISSEQNPQHSYAVSGEYLVKLTVTNACGGTSVYEQTISMLSEVTTPAFLEAFKIYPNPASNFFTLQLKGAPQKVLLVDVFNSTGQRLFMETIDFQSGSVTKDISCRDFPAGVYWVRVANAEKIGLQKIYIE